MDNGNLIITYKMMRLAAGISSKNAIALGLRQLEALGMLAVNRGNWSMQESQPMPLATGSRS
jgi:hypothetical protein